MAYYFKAGMIDPKYVARARRNIEENGEPYFGSSTNANAGRLGKMTAKATPRRADQPRQTDPCVTAVLHTDETCGLVCINNPGDTGYTWRQYLEMQGVDLRTRKARAKALAAFGFDESDLDYEIPTYTLAEIDPVLAVQSGVWSAFGVLEPILGSSFFTAGSAKEAPPEADVELGHFFLASGGPGMSYEGFHASSLLAVSVLHYCITALDSAITLEFADDYPDL